MRAMKGRYLCDVPLRSGLLHESACSAWCLGTHIYSGNPLCSGDGYIFSVTPMLLLLSGYDPFEVACLYLPES